MLAGSGDGAAVAADAPVAVKEAVLPFHRFRRADGSGVDSLLGPEMKSTGEVMGIDHDFGSAFAKSFQLTSTKPWSFKNWRNSGPFTMSRSCCRQAAPQSG